MAAPGGKYFIQDQLPQNAPHHESFERLWETKWKRPCSLGVYPFMFSAIQDFEPVVKRLIKENHRPPYDWDAYAAAFAPKAEELIARAEAAEQAGRLEEASELYLRASSVYRISRFPYPRSSLQRKHWALQVPIALRGLRLLPFPVHQVHIPFGPTLPDEASHIPAFHHLPSSASTSSPVPCVLLLTGLDGYRTDLAVWATGWAALGVATLIMEIPGTGDCPASATEPMAAERLFDAVLAWLQGQDGIDETRVVVWGFSTGGYQTIRLAHTHPDSFLGLVAQGGGCHHMLDAEWLDGSQKGEYPFDLGGTLAWKFGYGDDFEAFKREGRKKWSLLEDGTLDKKCGRLLVVNGTEDGIFPADDCFVACENGNPKELRLVRGKGHMGEPESFGVILRWIYGLLGIQANPVEQLRTIPFKAKQL
ncbi:Cell morphoproteinsis protein PAG1 [Sphaceloma murrayae]|uniref:Cell morphoproteinsis protein PAG1 n=1 Tax=Sphaceloma murrayae TaxID=2082308 RepID=A0A2K1QMH5_9PEZI|nr:Cell morphoproteinsis protein PAG1 [Sphaceloma murrayae]